MFKDNLLMGRRIAVFAGTAGIGLATAKLAGKLGATVFISSRTPARVQKALTELGLPEERGVVCDVAVPAHVRDFLAHVGAVDVAVINPGGSEQKNFRDMSPEEIDDTIKLNFGGPAYAVQQSWKHLNPGGAIVVTGSAAARMPLPMSAVYSSQKLGMARLVQELAVQMERESKGKNEGGGQRINIVEPGAIATESLHGAPQQFSEALFRETFPRVPGGKPGTPDDVAMAIIFAATARYLNGAVITVDGAISHT